ncbi:DEAD/DEAH box helicase [Bradyrhizobium septentrionale]|uniref:DEAD/DEAH box helicase n=1 Tax=Bradyrhizobium septentrionale TaxID=1404411 RepID=A0A973W0N9_9BRAD|nr:DEAD/DEAH box helicase [Bradyrhizobium septentrionale]UGY13854.1 DEAD/DEAH box helicase [Bradyrhizobium septentrionale]
MPDVPNLSERLRQKDLLGFFSRSAVDKAVVYRAQGRVSGVEISEDLTRVQAQVRGTERKPYRVDIVLEFDGDRLVDVDGDCSCPMAVNCKHVAATLFEALQRPARSAGTAMLASRGATGNGQLRPDAVLPYQITEWIETVGRSVRDADYPPDVTQRLLYYLQPALAVGCIPCMDVSLVSVKILKTGEFGSKVSQPSLGEFSVDRAPKYYLGSDIDVLVRLASEFRSGYTLGRRAYSADVLKRIVATGRAFWRDHSGAALQWDEARDGRIAWRQVSKDGIGPLLTVEGATALNAEPPVYVDAAAGLIGPIRLNLPERLSSRILLAPAIPHALVGQVVQRLGQKLPGLDPGWLPEPPAAAVKVNVDPEPVLRLMLGHKMAHAYYYGDRTPDRVPVARVSFRYGPVEIEQSESAHRVESFHDGSLYVVARRKAKEKEMAARLTSLGLVDARSAFPLLDAVHMKDLTFAQSTDWLDFLNVDAAGLQAAGFEIRIDDDFPYRLATSSGVFDADFESSGIDWFELALGIEIDGERRDLAPLLAALISQPGFAPEAVKQLADDGASIYLPLADGRYLAMAADRFLPLVLALHSLALREAFVDASGKIRLSRAQIVPLLGLEADHFVFRGAENLRRMAGLLGARGLPAPVLPPDFNAVLRPYQTQGLAWLELLTESGLGGVLADDMGLGKTVQILALLALEKARGHLTDPAIVVAPTSLMTNWFNEARKFTPGLRILVLHGPARRQSFEAIADHDLILTTYPLIARDHEVLLAREWHVAVLDEAQTIKNSNATITRRLQGIRARHRFCLTGTPMENHLGELWSIMSFANPGYLGDRASFVRDWRTPIEKRADLGRARVLTHRIKPFLLRRTKQEVAAELPPKSEFTESVVIEGSQRELYDAIRLSMSEKVRKAIRERGLGKSHIVVLEALLRMRQACCDPALLNLDDGVKHPSAKLDRLMEMVEELLSEKRKIIIFSQFTSMLALIRKRCDALAIRYSVLTGETKDRRSAIDGFQNGASDLFLISLKAGGVGLNLTAADTVIIFDPWWNPAVEEQAIDRAHRIGQDKALFVYRLVAKGTIEEKMDELKARKRALADSIFDSKGRIGAALTEEDVQALFVD